MGAVDSVRARLTAVYALSFYLPVSRAAAVQRRLSRTLRGKSAANVVTRLPRTAWSDALPNSPIRLVETEKRFGNVSLSELAILAQASAQTEPGSEIIEIGTFDGHTTLNIAVNAPEHTPVVTLDLPDNHPTRYELEASERRLVEKPASGGSASAPAGRRGAATPAASPRCSEIPRALTGRRTTAWPGSCSSTARMPTTTPARTPRRRFGW
jgi:hypothetical protein